MKKTPNPKDLFGVKKVPSYSVVPATSMIYEALGMWDGAGKYGPFNWRDHPVLASVYFDALDRHVKALVAGQWIDPKSGMPHAGHAKACLGILIDAYESKNLIWNLPPMPEILVLLEQYDRSQGGTLNASQEKKSRRVVARRNRSSRKVTRVSYRKNTKRR